jgi:hypothetical protein
MGLQHYSIFYYVENNYSIGCDLMLGLIHLDILLPNRYRRARKAAIKAMEAEASAE